MVFYRGLIFRLKTTQFAFSTAHRTKSLYLAITLLVTQVRCQSQHLTNTTLHRTTDFSLYFTLFVRILHFPYTIHRKTEFLRATMRVRCCEVLVRCLANTAHHHTHYVTASYTTSSAVCGRKRKLCFYRTYQRGRFLCIWDVLKSLSRCSEKCPAEAQKCP